MSGAIIVGTLTTVVVFFPLVFVRGMSGVMFKQLAFVVRFALLCSLFVALTLVPMLCGRYLSAEKFAGGKPGSFAHKLVSAILGFFHRLEDSYKRLLHFSLNHRAAVLGVVLAMLAGSLVLIKLVGSEFMPATDEGEVRVSVEMEVGTKLSLLDEKFKVIADIIRKDVPELRSLEESLGGGGWRSGSHTGNFTLRLSKRGERTRSSEEIATDLRQNLSSLPGVIVRTRASGGQMMFGMRGGGGQERVQVEIRGYDLQVGEALAQQVRKVIEGVEGVTDIRLSREMGNPEELFVIDRQAAADMKLSVSQIGETIQTVLMGTQASNFREAGREFRILVKVKDSERLDVEKLLDLTLTNADGEPVSLRNVVNVRPRGGPSGSSAGTATGSSTSRGRSRAGTSGRCWATSGKGCARSPSPGISASVSPATTKSSRRPSASCC